VGAFSCPSIHITASLLFRHHAFFLFSPPTLRSKEQNQSVISIIYLHNNTTHFWIFFYRSNFLFKKLLLHISKPCFYHPFLLFKTSFFLPAINFSLCSSDKAFFLFFNTPPSLKAIQGYKAQEEMLQSFFPSV